MSELLGDIYYSDNEYLSGATFNEQLLNRENIIYEVLRSIDGVPLFFEDHFARLRLSSGLVGQNLNFGEQKLKEIILMLQQKNQIFNCNVKLMLINTELGRKLIVHLMKAKYPETDEYKKGVDTKIYFSERSRPNAKVLNNSWRQALEEFISTNQIAEAILVDKNNQITEASRSNLFFIKDNQLFSTPEKMVLPGVTRRKTIQLAKNLGIHYSEKIVKLNELKKFDALLLSSTSKKLLPIKSVDNWLFNPQNEMAQKLVNAFADLENTYIKTRK
jgi:branched-chain amino acid aminotransferase